MAEDSSPAPATTDGASVNTKKPNSSRRRNQNSQRGDKKGKGSSGMITAKQEPDPHKAVTLPELSAEAHGELCLVCADEIQYHANYKCGHSICHKCAMRLRALMNNQNCALCRTSSDTIVITKQQDKHFEDFASNDLIFKDEKLGIYYDEKETKENVQTLLKFNCPLKSCDSVLLNWKDLKAHVRNEHHKNLCDICCRFKKAFTIELEVYTQQQLAKHEREGDKKGFSGHPQCEFCRIRYYSDDELFLHLRESHEKCFLCEREHHGRPQYYKNYDSLEAHFKDKHFACLVQSCLNEKFVVFGTKVELQDHMLDKHPSIMGKSKAARRIEPTFTSSRGGNSRFQGHLSTVSADALPPTATTATTTTTTHSPSLSTEGESFPVLGSRTTATPTYQPAAVTRFHNDLPPEDTSRNTTQKRIDERVRMWLNFNQLKFNKFQETTTRFSKGKMTALELVSEYNRLLDIPPNDMDILIHETSQLYKGEGKAKALKAAFKEWADKQSFPTLGASLGASSRATTTGTSLSPSWVASRSGPQKASNLKDQHSFPSLPSRPTPPASRPLSASSSSTSLSGTTKKLATITLGAKRTGSPQPIGPKISTSKDEFPTLPSGKKRTAPLNPINPHAAAVAWSSRNDQSASASESEDPPLGENSIGSKGKSKKQVLCRMGL